MGLVVTHGLNDISDAIYTIYLNENQVNKDKSKFHNFLHNDAIKHAFLLYGA